MKITDALKMMEEAQVKSFLPKEEEKLDNKKTSVCVSCWSSKVEYIPSEEL